MLVLIQYKWPTLLYFLLFLHFIYNWNWLCPWAHSICYWLYFLVLLFLQLRNDAEFRNIWAGLIIRGRVQWFSFIILGRVQWFSFFYLRNETRLSLYCRLFWGFDILITDFVNVAFYHFRLWFVCQKCLCFWPTHLLQLRTHFRARVGLILFQFSQAFFPFHMIHVKLRHCLPVRVCLLKTWTFVLLFYFFGLVLNFAPGWFGRVWLHVVGVLAPGRMFGNIIFQSMLSLKVKLQFSSGVGLGFELTVRVGSIIGVDIVVFGNADIVFRWNVITFNMREDSLLEQFSGCFLLINILVFRPEEEGKDIRPILVQL